MPLQTIPPLLLLLDVIPPALLLLLLLLPLDEELELLEDDAEELELLAPPPPSPPELPLGSCSLMSAMMWQPNTAAKDDADRKRIAARAVEIRSMPTAAYRQTQRVDKAK